jgi:hypothetical protein
MLPNNPLFRKPGSLERFLMPAIIVLVALSAFGLGRLSAAPERQGTLRVLYPEARAAEPLANTAAVAGAVKDAKAPQAGQGSGAYVASKNGSKYYLATCSSASRIKQENRVYFASRDEAVAAGYGPAANCPGL